MKTCLADATKYRPDEPVNVVTFSYSLTMIPDWFAAIDLSLRRDATSMVLTGVDEKKTMRSIPFFWIPEEPASERAEQDQKALRNYAANGLVRTTPGMEIASDDLLMDILDILDEISGFSQTGCIGNGKRHV